MQVRRTVSRRSLLSWATLAGSGALLAACEAAPQAAATGQAAAAATAPAASTGPQKLVAMFGGGSEANIEVFNQQIEIFQRDYPDVSVEITPGANNEKLLAAMASGTPPDVAWPWGAPASGSWAANGLLTQLDPLMDKTGFDRDNIVPALLQQGELDGKIWSLPWLADTHMFYWNKSLLAQEGMDSTPETWEDAIPQAKALTKLDSGGELTQLGLRAPGGISWWGLAFSFGAELMNSSKTEVTPDSEGFVNCLNWALELYATVADITKVELFQSTWGDQMSDQNYMVKGQLAMSIAPEWWLAFLERATPEGLAGLELSPIPHTAAKPDLVDPGETLAATLYIPAGVANPDLSWALVESLMSDESTLLFAKLESNVSQNISSFNDPELRAIGGGKMGMMLDYMKSPNIRSFPNSPVVAEYQDALNREIELVVHGQKSPEEGLAAVKSQVQPKLDPYLARKSSG